VSARYSAWIRIGGSLDRSQADELIKAIRADYSRLDWGEPPFEPTTAEELIAARSDERLWLCDGEARYGEFDALESACRKLGLSYRRHTEAWCGEDAVLVDWHPSMTEPLVRPASNEDGDVVLVPEQEVHKALAALNSGEVAIATAMLRKLCPVVPEIPPFMISGSAEPDPTERQVQEGSNEA